MPVLCFLQDSNLRRFARSQKAPAERFQRKARGRYHTQSVGCPERAVCERSDADGRILPPQPKRNKCQQVLVPFLLTGKTGYDNIKLTNIVLHLTERVFLMKKKQKSGSISFISCLTLLLIVLKLTGKVTFSWIWVFSPLWLSALLLALVFLIILIAGRIKKGSW